MALMVMDHVAVTRTSDVGNTVCETTYNWAEINIVRPPLANIDRSVLHYGCSPFTTDVEDCKTWTSQGRNILFPSVVTLGLKSFPWTTFA